MSSTPTATTASTRILSTRKTSNLGTRRDKFLRSLGIPSFQHAISHKPTSYASTGVSLERPPSEGLTTSTLTPLDLDRLRMARQKETPSGKETESEGLLQTLDTDKRFSSIRLRNYTSIGNLDQQAREDLSGAQQQTERELGRGTEPISVSRSMPLGLCDQSQNEEMDGKCSTPIPYASAILTTRFIAFAGNLATIHVSSVVSEISSLPSTPQKKEVVVLLEG